MRQTEADDFYVVATRLAISTWTFVRQLRRPHSLRMTMS
jgi:hypothetical protein